MSNYEKLYNDAAAARERQELAVTVLRSALDTTRTVIAERLTLEFAGHSDYHDACEWLISVAAGSPGYWSNGPLGINNVYETMSREEALKLLRYRSHYTWQSLRDKYNSTEEVTQ